MPNKRQSAFSQAQLDLMAERETESLEDGESWSSEEETVKVATSKRVLRLTGPGVWMGSVLRRMYACIHKTPRHQRTPKDPRGIFDRYLRRAWPTRTSAVHNKTLDQTKEVELWAEDLGGRTYAGRNEAVDETELRSGGGRFVCYIHAWSHGVKLKCSVDTGATISVISLAAVKRLGIKSLMQPAGSSLSFYPADGAESFPVAVIPNLQLQIGGLEVQRFFMVMKKARFVVLLGLNVLLPMRACLDLDERKYMYTDEERNRASLDLVCQRAVDFVRDLKSDVKQKRGRRNAETTEVVLWAEDIGSRTYAERNEAVDETELRSGDGRFICYIHAWSHGVKLKCSVVTGATISIISLAAVKRLGIKSSMQPTKSSFYQAGETKSFPVGMIPNLRLRIGGLEVQRLFMVVKKAPFVVLLGMNTLLPMRACLDFDRMKFVYTDEEGNRASLDLVGQRCGDFLSDVKQECFS